MNKVDNHTPSTPFPLPGPEFKAHRRLLTPAMTSKFLSGMTPGIIANVKQLYRFWDEKRAYLDYDPFDPALDFNLSTMVRNYS